jgi:hypothetical protein
MTTNKEYSSIDDLINDLTQNLNEKEASETIEKLLEKAYDIRKFEIELYWKRATYFWGFLVATFAAYFLVTDKAKFGQRPELEAIVLCIGFIFSLSWYLVNRGSKYWQANWEKIIDTFEEKLKRPLYRINLNNNRNQYAHLFSRYPFSVSRINIIVSLFLTALWLLLIAVFLISNINIHKPFNYLLLAIILLTLTTTYLLLTKGRSSRDGQYSLEKRNLQYYSETVRPNP